MTFIEQQTPSWSAHRSPRQAVTLGLAIVGFIALVSFGIWLAVYSTRYVPKAIDGLGTAAVYVGSLFGHGSSPSLSVVPTASTTIPFGSASTTPEAASSTNAKSSTSTIPSTHTSVPVTAGKQTESTSLLGGTTTPVLSGLPDLQTTIVATGYLATSSPDSFVAATTVPAGSRAAVHFIIKNIGTNATGAWCWRASIPTTSSQIYQSAPQQNLNPGDYIDYTLGFDQAVPGAAQTISVTANPTNSTTPCTTINESNMNNNTASAKVTILGS